MRPSSKFLLLLNALGGAGGSHPTTVLVLTWTSTSATAAPTFTVDGDLAAGDVLTYQTAVSGTGFASPTNTTHTITAPEDAANEAAGVLPTLSNGTYDVRVSSTRGGFAFGSSNVVTITISVAGNQRISSTGNNRISSAGNNRKYA